MERVLRYNERLLLILLMRKIHQSITARKSAEQVPILRRSRWRRLEAVRLSADGSSKLCILAYIGANRAIAEWLIAIRLITSLVNFTTLFLTFFLLAALQLRAFAAAAAWRCTWWTAVTEPLKVVRGSTKAKLF